MDILPNLPPSRGFDNIKTAIDSFQDINLHTQQPVLEPLQSQESLWTICVITHNYQRP